MIRIHKISKLAIDTKCDVNSSVKTMFIQIVEKSQSRVYMHFYEHIINVNI